MHDQNIGVTLNELRASIFANEGTTLTDEELHQTAVACLRELQWRLPVTAVEQGDLPEFHREAALYRRELADRIDVPFGTLNPPEECPTCDGTSRYNVECQTCCGDSWFIENVETGERPPCEDCNGTGEVEQDCEECV